MAAGGEAELGRCAGLCEPPHHRPYAASGGNDVKARTVAEKMSKTLGQQIVSRIGAAPAAASPPPDRQGTACEIAGIPPISKGRQSKCGPPSPPKLRRVPDA